MVVFTASSVALFALGAFVAVPSVSAQAVGVSSVQCLPSFGWANNSLQQNPCLVTAYLQAQCSSGTFTINPLNDGFHYIGPTNDTTTQNPCICSTPVYMLESACGLCQNRTIISWGSWSANCPAAITAPEGEYTQVIPPGTRVPHWAYLKPSDSGDFFDPNAAKLVGDTPESSQVQSSTASSSSPSSTAPASTTTSANQSSGTSTATSSGSSPTNSSGGGGGGSSHTGAIAGGVVGGVLGLALLALLGFFLVRRNRNKHNPIASPQMTAAGTGPAASTGPPASYVQPQPTGPTVATAGSGGYYNPNEGAFPQQQPYAPQQGGYAPQPPQAGYYNAPPQGRYSGMPEV